MANPSYPPAAFNLTTTSATPATGIASLTNSGTSQLGTLTQFQISGTYGTVTLTFEITTDGSVWVPVSAILQATNALVTGTISPANNLSAVYSINTAGAVGCRMNITAIASGTVVVSAQSGSYVGMPNTQTASSSNQGAITATSLTASGAILSSSTVGIGYTTGAGAAVTQGTSRTTTVVCNGASGAITLFSAAGSATPFSFTVTNSSVAATDTVIVSQKSGTDIYTTQVVSAVGAGSFRLTLANASGTTTETPVFNFAVIKAVAA